MGGNAQCGGFMQGSVNGGFFFHITAAVPLLVFLCYLGSTAKNAVAKLRFAPSNVMAVYYYLICGVTAGNLIFACASITPLTNNTTTWNLLWLCSAAAQHFLEVLTIVAFMKEYFSTNQGLWRALRTALGIVAVDIVSTAVYIFSLKVPLFIVRDISSDSTWPKWSFWLVHSLIAIAVYLFLLCAPIMDWSASMHHKIRYFMYMGALLALHTFFALASLLAGAGVGFGYCMYGAGTWMYFSLYVGFFYFAVLQDFFSQGLVDVDMLYYQEMRDAGCLDETDEERW